jgi:seryl-tRNA synthetase
MLDLRLIREDADGVAKALARRGVAPNAIADIADLDIARRAAQARLDEARAEQNSAGKGMATLKGDEKDALRARLTALKQEIDELEQRQASSASALNALLLQVPNIPHESVPDGATEDDNVVLREWGTPTRFDFEPRDHLAIGEALDIIDMERGARMSGSRFSVLKGRGAMLWMALSRFALETVARQGHTPVLPPVLVRREAMEGTGFIPAGEDQIYQLPADELYLVGTSEVPLAALHMSEIIDPATLPLRYVGHSVCFRREAGALGKDTRGIFRNHQFEKVEMFVFTTPEQSWAEHERLVGIEEEILRALELPYRAVALCTGDLGSPSAKTIDCEVWFPGQGRYRETTSCSNTTDYQARRLNCRIKGEKGTTFLHTLNGTVVTSSRHVAAILENFQREDGSVVVPEVLRPFTGFDTIS